MSLTPSQASSSTAGNVDTTFIREAIDQASKEGDSIGEDVFQEAVEVYKKALRDNVSDEQAQQVALAVIEMCRMVIAYERKLGELTPEIVSLFQEAVQLAHKDGKLPPGLENVDDVQTWLTSQDPEGEELRMSVDVVFDKTPA